MKNKGFTIVELIVAVAILGVLTIIAIPSVKTIQDNNRNAKYIAYEKAIKSASKAYVDAYDEDLFGSINSGCATIPYSKLKEKELIEDIQVKDISCDGDDDTYVYVFKQRNGNHAYYVNIKCRNGSAVVYSKQEQNRESCGIEDDQGPTVTIVNSVTISDPVDDPYNNGKAGIEKGAKYPKLSALVEDKNKADGAQAIGLRPDHQKLHYQWYKNGSALSGTDAKGDLNVIVKDYYYPNASIDIPIPKSDMDVEEADALYTVKVSGTVEDMDGNKTTKDLADSDVWQPEYPENPSGFEFEKRKKCPTMTFYENNETTVASTQNVRWYNTNREPVKLKLTKIGALPRFEANSVKVYYQFNSNSYVEYKNLTGATQTFNIGKNTSGTVVNGKMKYKTAYQKKYGTRWYTCSESGQYGFDHDQPHFSYNFTHGDSVKSTAVNSSYAGSGWKSIKVTATCTDDTSPVTFTNKGTAISTPFSSSHSSRGTYEYDIKCVDKAKNTESDSGKYRVLEKGSKCGICKTKTRKKYADCKNCGSSTDCKTKMRNDDHCPSCDSGWYKSGNCGRCPLDEENLGNAGGQKCKQQKCCKDTCNSCTTNHECATAESCWW